MRTITAPERATIGGQSIEYHLRVEIQNESGTWVNYSDDPVGGLDWVDEVTLTDSIDQPVAGGTLRLKREAHDGSQLLSLAPFMATSPLNVDDLLAYSPVIHPGRGVRIWLAPIANGTGRPADVSALWRKIFDGILGKPQWGPEHTIEVGLRDLGARLADAIIEELREYGSTAGVRLDLVIQQILDDNGLGAITLSVPVIPNWFLEPYEQARVPVFEAIRALALQIGWDLRYRYAGAGVLPVLTLFAPERNPVFVNLTNGIQITADEYSKVTDLQIGDDEVRNFGRLKYVTSAGTTAEVTASDPASIGTFGRRYIEIGEAHTSNINTAVEAQAMIDYVIEDLATPFADHAIETFHLWPLQLGDLLEFAANDVHYSDDQTYAIVAMTHRFAKGHGDSTIQTRGKPAGAYRTWINMHGSGPGNAAGVPAPIFTFLLGEESHGGGVTGDGMVWIGVVFEKNTEYVEFWAEEGDSAATPAPDIANNSSALRLFRQEGIHTAGVIFSDVVKTKTPKTKFPDWQTVVGIATRPFRWRKIRACGFGRTGIKGPDWTPPAVQAIDPTPTPIDGVIASFAVSSVLDVNILDVTPGAIDPGGGNFIFIRRDGVDIFQLFIDADTSPRAFSDTFINPQTPYNYEVFIWNNGVSGKHRRHAGGIAIPSTFTWDGQAPKLVWDSGLGLYKVALMWLVTGHPTADHIVFEYAPDGIHFVEFATTSIVSTVISDFNILPKWYRMRLEDAADAVLAYSTPAYFAGQGLPPSQGALEPPTWNPEPGVEYLRAPTLSIGIASLVMGFICVTSGARTCAIQRSDDDGIIDPWVDQYESGQLAGDQWHAGPGIGPGYYRLAAKDAAGSVLVVSNSILWPGFV